MHGASPTLRDVGSEASVPQKQRPAGANPTGRRTSRDASWLTAEALVAVIADEGAGVRVEAPVARIAVGIPVRRPGRRAVAGIRIDGPGWRRRGRHVDFARGKCAADDGANAEAEQACADRIPVVTATATVVTAAATVIVVLDVAAAAATFPAVSMPA